MNASTKRDFVVTRIFNAPVELVWQAWTDPQHLVRWWGPKDYTSPSCKVDLREGGTYLFCMRAPQEQGGRDYYSAGVYKQIIPLQRLEFNQNLTDENGQQIDPTQVGMPADFPQDIQFVLEFKALDDNRTELTVTEYGWSPGQLYEYSVLGLNQSLDKLAETLL